MINNKLFLTLAASLFLTAPANADPTIDPYAAVEHIQLQNGLQIFLAPSNEASLTSIRLEVGVGTESEEGADIGVSHLLEHVLFRDKNLAEEMSYLQLIKEAGGSANGGTYDRKTDYFGSIPANKGLWLFETFGKMLLNPSFEDKYVQKEKGTIEIERGRPSPLQQTIGFNPMSLLLPKYLEKKSFWESEFNYSSKDSYSLISEQLSTQKLTAEQVENHYTDYYYPKNMKLFIAGKFDRVAIMNEIKKNWENIPATEGKSMAPEPVASPRMAPYFRTTLNTEPSVSIGSKIWGADAQESTILNSFTSYLAHRMMKEIRNIKGQTYTAFDQNHLYKGYGYITVSFRTPEENFDENLKIARQYFDEARAGKLTAAHVKEALGLELSTYNLRGKEAQDMMAIANAYASLKQEFGTFQSPYATLATVTPEVYNKTLSKFLVPELAYETLNQPPLIFHYDQQLIYGLSLIFIFMGFRALLTQRFQNNQVRWIRKVEYPPIKLAEGFALIAAWYLCVHLQYVVDKVFFTDLMQRHILTSQYLYAMVSVIAVIFSAQGVYSFMPRKLMVHGDELMIKSVTYYSKRFLFRKLKKSKHYVH
jgi:zinc protease